MYNDDYSVDDAQFIFQCGATFLVSGLLLYKAYRARTTPLLHVPNDTPTELSIVIEDSVSEFERESIELN